MENLTIEERFEEPYMVFNRYVTKVEYDKVLKNLKSCEEKFKKINELFSEMENIFK